MTATICKTMTVRDLLALVEHLGPEVADSELSFLTDPATELLPVLGVLHTGIRALLAGRCWWGSTTGKPRVVEMNSAAPIPTGITLLAVEGDERWDRISPVARIDLPHLFVIETNTPAARNRRGAR